MKDLAKIAIVTESEFNTVLKPPISKLKHKIIYSKFNSKTKTHEINTIRFLNKPKFRLMYNRACDLYAKLVNEQTEYHQIFIYLFNHKTNMPIIIKTADWEEDQVINLIYTSINLNE